MGGFGAEVVPDGARVLTHCNAGALATAGYGSALGVIRAAVEQGKKVAVFADETRPFLQGARLTAWELVRDGIHTTVITESMAGPLMRAGEIDLVVVGADRIAANGDTANKIGTYTVAVLAREHKIPFYVAAPLSTIDLATPDGDQIPIEERDRREVTHLGSSRLTPEGAHIRNPAFDVTPHRYITGIITEKGIFGPPYSETPERGLRPRQPGSREPARHRDLVRRDRRGASSPRPAIAARPWRIRSSIVASQTAIHREWGGVVPELASRQHVRDICGVVEAALAQAGAQTRRRRRRRRDAGPGPRRVAARRRRVREGVRVGARPSGHPGASSGRAHRVADARARRAAAAGGRPRRLRRTHEPLSRARARRLSPRSAARETMRRARRMTRWPSCWASAIRADR